jgi:hypothetical protein
LFSRFEPGARSLPAGFQVWPRLKPLSVDIVFVKGVAVTVLGGVSVYVDLGRPAGAEKVPAILAWSPYGKSRGNAPRYVKLFALLGMETAMVSGRIKFERSGRLIACGRAKYEKLRAYPRKLRVDVGRRSLALRVNARVYRYPCVRCGGCSMVATSGRTVP